MAKARNSRNISVASMAEQLKVTAKTINNYERDRHPVPRSVLISWSWITRWPLEWIEFGTEPDTAPDTPGGQGISTTGCNGDTPGKVLTFPRIARPEAA